MLAERLVRAGEEVVVTRRDAAAATALVESLTQAGGRAGQVRGAAVDLAAPTTLAGVIPDGAIVVVCAPPAGAYTPVDET